MARLMEVEIYSETVEGKRHERFRDIRQVPNSELRDTPDTLAQRGTVIEGWGNPAGRCWRKHSTTKFKRSSV